MARRKRGPVRKPQRWTAWLSIVAAYSIGMFCVAAGVLILVYGKAEPVAGEKPVEGSVAWLGSGFIFIGVLALAIIGYMHWLKTRR